MIVFLVLSFILTRHTKAANGSSPRRHLIVATIELAPFMMKREVNNTIEWYGYCMDFFQELIKTLPYSISYELYQAPDNKFGSKNLHVDTKVTNAKLKSESWNGLIGEIQKGRAHIALAPLSVMAERELVIDFTVPFYDLVGIQILVKKPEVPRDIFKFLTVLDGEVWLSIMVAYFVTSFVIFLFDRLSPYSHKNISRISQGERGRKSRNPLNDRISTKISSASTNRTKLDWNINKRHRYSNATKKRMSTLQTSSWAESIKNAGRRSSIFLVNGLDSLYAKRMSIYPANNFELARSPEKVIEDRKQSNFSKSPAASYYETDESDTDDGKPDFGFKDSLWFCITSLTPQGGGEAPMNLSGRIVAGSWWLFCFIIIASYTANLAAFLTVSRLDIPIDSLDDLAKQYRIKYAPVDGTAEHAYFERMAHIEEIFYNIWRDMSLNESLSEEERSRFAVWDYPISDKYTKIWTQIKQVSMPPSYETGIDRVKQSDLEDGFALLADANIIKHAVMTDCSFKAVGDEFSRKPIALGVQKGDDGFRDELSHAILRLINKRFMEILREKWWTNNPNRVDCDSSEESEGIGIENIGGVFIIIGAGVLLSFIVWAAERFAYQTRIEVSQDLILRD